MYIDNAYMPHDRSDKVVVNSSMHSLRLDLNIGNKSRKVITVAVFSTIPLARRFSRVY